VNVEVETWKDAAQISELYERACEKQAKPLYKAIQLRMKECESNQRLNLNSQNLSLNQLSVVFDTIKLNNTFLAGLTAINLSSNVLNDEFLFGFLDSAEKMSNLKILDLSYNQFTFKSLKYFSQILKRLVS
jgi:hypothetical protein